MTNSGRELRTIAVEGRERADDIKALFRRNGRSDVVTMFDDSYPNAGGRSWIAVNAHDNVVMHVALFPCEIGDGRRVWRGGLLGDLMADPQHRDFFGPVRLVRQLVSDARRQGIELLYSDPIKLSASVLKAAGFGPLGALRRYVMPASWPFRWYAALRGARALRVVSTRGVDDVEVHSAIQRLQARGPVRVLRTPVASVSRAGGAASENRWLWLESSRIPGEPSALLLVRSTGRNGRLIVMDFRWDDAVRPIADALLTTARWASHTCHRWLDLHILEASFTATLAQRIGFLARADAQPIVIRHLAGAPVPPAPEWFLDRLDGSAW